MKFILEFILISITIIFAGLVGHALQVHDYSRMMMYLSVWIVGEYESIKW